MLSRAPVDVVVDELNEEQLLDFETCEFESEQYKNLVNEIQENAKRLPDLKIISGKVFKRIQFDQDIGVEYQLKLWIPDNLTVAIIERAHAPKNVAHGGIAKTLERVKRYFYWPKMTSHRQQEKKL